MSRCASGSSSSSSPGRRARQAASATSFRCPPLRIAVGASASSSVRPSERRIERASPSAPPPPAAVQRSSRRSWWRARAECPHVSICTGVRKAPFDECQLALELTQLGPGVDDRRDRGALVAVHDLREVGDHEAAPGGHLAGIRLVRARDDPEQRRLPAAVRPEHADAGAIGHGELQSVQNPAPAEGLDDAARGEQRDGAGHQISLLRIGECTCTLGCGNGLQRIGGRRRVLFAGTSWSAAASVMPLSMKPPPRAPALVTKRIKRSSVLRMRATRCTFGTGLMSCRCARRFGMAPRS